MLRSIYLYLYALGVTNASSLSLNESFPSISLFPLINFSFDFALESIEQEDKKNEIRWESVEKFGRLATLSVLFQLTSWWVSINFMKRIHCKI